MAERYRQSNPHSSLSYEGHFKKSIGAFEDCLEIKPDNENLMFMIATAYIYIKKYPKSFEWLDKVLEINPDDLNALKH